MDHNTKCIQNALAVINENNEMTAVTEYGVQADDLRGTPESYRLTPETSEEANEWANNGNARCVCSEYPES